MLLTAIQNFQQAERNALIKNDLSVDQSIDRLQRLCAAVNSCSNGERQTQELVERLRGMLPETFRGGLEPSFERAQTEFLTFGRELSEAIGNSIVCDDGFNKALQKLFVDDSWHNGTLVQALGATIEDYFYDVSTWVEESFFKRVADSVMQYTVRAYIAAFLERRTPLTDAVLKRIEEDEEVLVASLSKFTRKQRASRYTDLLARMVDLARAEDDDSFVSALCAANRCDQSISIDAADRIATMRDIGTTRPSPHVNARVHGGIQGVRPCSRLKRREARQAQLAAAVQRGDAARVAGAWLCLLR